MRKRIITTVIACCMLLSIFSTAYAVRTVDEVVEAALQLLYYNEGSYGSVNANDNGAVSVGKIQWHGNRALNLLKTIVDMDRNQAQSILGSALYNEILTSTDWSTRIVNSTEKSAISALLVTSNGKAAQDRLATNDVTSYINHGKNLGIVSDPALVYFADLENQGGAGMSRRVAGAAAVNTGTYANITLHVLHNAALADGVAGQYATRRNRTFTYCQGLGWDDVDAPMDLGTDFYAMILNTACWKPIGVDEDGWVHLETEVGDAHELWKFVRQNDGSYIICSAETGKLLGMHQGDITPSNPVEAVDDDWGGAYQRWFLYLQGNGYILRSAHYPEENLVLDLYENNTSDGTNITTFPRNNTDAQIWTIYRGEEIKLSAATLAVDPGTANSATKFSWSDARGESRYDLKIWQGTVWTGDAYRIVECFDSTGFELQLPAGTYQAYVDSVNYYECKMSNLVTFTVEGCVHAYISQEIAPTCTEQGYTIHTCSDCGHSYKDSYTSAKGHSFKDGRCTECGMDDPNALMAGDLDGDGTVASADAVLLARYLVDLTELTDKQLQAADVDHDGAVTSGDSVRLARFLAGVITAL